MAAAVEAKALFRTFLREGRRFPNYNIREYILRRSKEAFRAGSTASEQEAASQLSKAKEELAVLRKQSLVYGLYTRKIKNVLEVDLKFKSRERIAQ